MTRKKPASPKPSPSKRDAVAATKAMERFDQEASPEATARRLAVTTVAQQFTDASSRNEIAAVLRSHPADIARDALWRAIHHDHEQIAAHEVGTMRLRDHADMLRSVTRTGASHLDADIPF